MQTHEYFIPGKTVHPLADEAVGTYMNAPHASTFDAVFPSGVRHMTPFERFKLQPSEVCPKKFIVFDQTDQQSRIFFNPATTYKFNSPGFNTHAAFTQDFEKDKINQMERELSSSFEEDSKDIDALLSLETDELANYDEEEVSTARTREKDESTSDTCSSYRTKSRKKRLLSSSAQNSSGSRSYCNSEKKQHLEMKRMVKMLRNIVPGGGNQMDTVTVLDEAVKYLKTLKVEVEQFGVGP
ncbi:transcription factor bHLH144 [Cicer arietinum]|uniref:Transcription factor bHLH144 n=1 Tax=Cicer arietinum TaxID=3827 RepID=A0A1S2YH10_CICAR|nr:transcription factor bHLH144 [Cicer arietinum]XP_027191879.1 transcription factor bHLH144 [Cicer arietinum]